MAARRSSTVYLWEFAWILPSIALPVSMLTALAVTALGAGITVVGDRGRIDSTKVAEHPLFKEPGVTEIAPGQYEVRLTGQIWSFAPNEIRVPAGSTVHFWATSKDLVHGLLVPRHNVNVMLLPGQISHAQARFDTPGEYPDHLPRVLRRGPPHDGRQDHRGGEAMTALERRLAAANLIVALVALFGGVTTGIFQALEYAGVEIYPSLAPFIRSHYHSVSIHGVLNALVFTTFFICGFLPFIFSRALGAPLACPRLAWWTFWIMTAGLVLAGIPLVGNAATVMFTFYPPLKAHWAFYLGLTLVVAGTWLVTLNLVVTWRAWRARHAGVTTPLAAFMSLVTFVMWSIASLGLAAEMLFMILPWSLGLVSGTDALLARTLFWFTGHPIVYFWLLPAYVSWYTLVPRQAGGKLFSDPMARTSFMLFLVLSTPIGIHHQYTDPGIHQAWKLLHALFTFAVFFPSLLTFFNVVASLETGGARAAAPAGSTGSSRFPGPIRRWRRRCWR